MRRKEFLELTYATPRQIGYWYKNGVKIGRREGEGSGKYIDYSILDAEICNVLCELSYLMGSNKMGMFVFRNLSGMLQNRPSFMFDNDTLFVGQYGTISENYEIQGYVIDLIQIGKKMREHRNRNYS